MITPGDRFNAFSSNRLIKKEENAAFGNNQKLILSPTKHSVFLFIHLLNRSITNIPWLFWISILFTFVQIALTVLQPFNENHWAPIPKTLSLNRVLSIILRYVPLSAPDIVQKIVFAIYSLLIVLHFILLFVIVALLKHKKDTNVLIKIFFFYSYLFLPIFRSSIICVVSEEVTSIVRDPSFASFFLSLFAFVILLLQLFMTCFIQLAMGSSPSPNLVSPLAIWGPCAWRSVIFDLYVSVCFIALEFMRSVDSSLIYAILNIILLIIGVLHALFQSVRTYYISYSAYEYIGGLLWASNVYIIMHIFISFMGKSIDFWVIIIVWVALPILGFIIMRSITQIRLRRFLWELDQCGIPTSIVDDDNQEDFVEENEHSSVYDTLKITTTSQAIFAARAACVVNHPAFGDLSLIKFFIEKFPDGLFFFLHLTFLVQNQTQFIQQLIDLFLDDNKPTYLQSCVLFQIITSIQESSNDLPQSLVRELGRQKLQSMKCQQLLSKFWTSCYKGDITQMSRHAFTLNKHINDLSNNWKLLVLRYPFSTPVLKDYIGYLSTTGTQHRVVEAILTNHPQLNDMTNTTSDQDLNMSILHQAVEDAVDRRPISSIYKLTIALIVSIIIALVFFLFIIILSFVLLDKYNAYNEFIYQSEYFSTIYSDIPNKFDDVIFEVDTLSSRSKIYDVTKSLANSLNAMLRQMPADILKDSSVLYHPLYIQIDLYNATRKSDFINSLRLTSYFAQSLAFVPINDTMVELVVKNLFDTFGVLNETMKSSIDGIENIVNIITKYSPIFYILNWALLIVIMIPLLYFSITALKEEMTYLFSIYLTIPRSTVTKFIETGGGKQQDKKNVALLMSTSFAHHMTTTTSMRDDDDNRAGGNVADSFKMLVNDSSANISVLPKNFILKASLIFSFLCGIIALLSSIGCYLFITFSESLAKCFYTQKIVGDRTIGASMTMHGITSCGEDVSLAVLGTLINETAKLHTAILFKDASYKLSAKALNSDAIVSIHSDERCPNKTDFKCRSLIMLFDYFINQASNITVTLKTQTLNRSLNNFQSLRRVFNDYLFPLLFETQIETYHFTKGEIKNFRTEILIIVFVSLATITGMFFVFVLPIIHEVQSTIQAVKLPLKHISPIEIADLQKVLMYLQGESDFKRGGNSEKGTESQGGNSILNVMLCPFAIFEDDLSLLFANNAFYTLLGTSREAAIGLPLSDIFSTVMPFKSCESHPFNSLLDTVSQLQRGVAPVNVVEIRTELELSSQAPCPIMVRLVGICKSAQEDEEETHQNLKASSYALFINDLSHKKALEEKMKYETDVSQKLIDATIPKSLASCLRAGIGSNNNNNNGVNIGNIVATTSNPTANTMTTTNATTIGGVGGSGDSIEPRKFGNIPMVMFTIKFSAQEEEFEDELMIACSLFMRTANDVNQNFSNSVTKLMQDPPHWFYISGHDNGQEDLNLAVTDLCHFALSVIEVFTASSTTNYVLGAIVHIGELTIIPLMLELPMVEAIGSGFQKLKETGDLFRPGDVICTQEVEAMINDQRSFVLAKIMDIGYENLYSIKRGVDQAQNEDGY